MEKAQAAIKKVAKEKGFNYVLDSTTGSGVLVADGTDLLADVKIIRFLINLKLKF